MSKELAIYHAKRLHGRLRKLWELSSAEGMGSVPTTSKPAGQTLQAQSEETVQGIECCAGGSVEDNQKTSEQSQTTGEGKQMDFSTSARRRKKLRLRIAKAVAYVVLGLIIGGMIFVWWSNSFMMMEMAPAAKSVGPAHPPVDSAPGGHGIPSEVIVAIISSVAGYGGHKFIDLIYKIVEKKLGLSE